MGSSLGFGRAQQIVAEGSAIRPIAFLTPAAGRTLGSTLDTLTVPHLAPRC